MAYLRGSSEAAGQLCDDIRNAAKELRDLLVNEERLLRELSESCRDDSFEKMEYVVRMVVTYVNGMLTEMAEASRRLRAYQELIDSLDTPNSDAVSSALEAKGYDRSVQAKWIGSHRSATVKQVGEIWSGSLNAEQRGAIKAHTGAAYADINATLRGLKTGLARGFASADNQFCAVQIHSALSKSSIPCDCVVYRGMSASALGKLEKLSDQELVGKVYTDNGFVSTSLNEEDAFAGTVRLEIEVPKGARGAYVGYISQHGHAESEVLFDMGQYMKILHVRRDQYGNRIIRARMML